MFEKSAEYRSVLQFFDPKGTRMCYFSLSMTCVCVTQPQDYIFAMLLNICIYPNSYKHFFLNKLAHTFYSWCHLVQGFTCPCSLMKVYQGWRLGPHSIGLPEEQKDAN